MKLHWYNFVQRRNRHTVEHSMDLTDLPSVGQVTGCMCSRSVCNTNKVKSRNRKWNVDITREEKAACCPSRRYTHRAHSFLQSVPATSDTHAPTTNIHMQLLCTGAAMDWGRDGTWSNFVYISNIYSALHDDHLQWMHSTMEISPKSEWIE